MGIHDRDYYRSRQPTPMRIVARSAVGIIICVNIGVWLLQHLVEPLTGFFACTSEQIFGGFPQVWRLVTACFVHDPNGIMHLLFNMLLLFFFGREIEAIYGKRDFLVLYLVAGAVAIFCETLVHQFGGSGVGTPILGASGSVMAVLVVFGMFFPRRTVFLFGIVPLPVWLLCVMLVVSDLFGAFHSANGVANVAHLGGAAFGFAYRYFDLRWSRVSRGLPAVLSLRFRSRRRASTPRARSSASHPLESPPSARSQAVSRRIDELLEKIHAEGMGSLSEEEREFLLQHSKDYKSS